MRTITDKMNEIEIQTRELLEKAQFLEDQKHMMTNLMDCNVQGHEWILRDVLSDLTAVFSMDIRCARCGAYAVFDGDREARIDIQTSTGAPLNEFLEEEE